MPKTSAKFQTDHLYIVIRGVFDLPESETGFQITALFQHFISAKQKHDTKSSESCPIHVYKPSNFGSFKLP